MVQHVVSWPHPQLAMSVNVYQTLRVPTVNNKQTCHVPRNGGDLQYVDLVTVLRNVALILNATNRQEFVLVG